MEVVDVGGVDQPVHRRVDRRRGAAAAVEAVVERATISSSRSTPG